MLISLNWLKQYVDIKIPTDELVTLIGARLVEVEGVIDQTHKYDNVYIVEVVTAEKIPDTHLTLCRINDSGVAKDVPRDSDGLIQVMCGAPNVRVGMLTAWISPGAVVPASFASDAPFLIGTRKMLKKYESHGMLAGADELDFGDDHSGIVEIAPNSANPGTALSEHFQLDDFILEIENKSLTHRPDTFGIIGFAREVAGILGQPFHTPDFLEITEFNELSPNQDLPLQVAIADPMLCPRYTALILSCKKALESKYLNFMQTLLARSGMRPISPLVDLTNYLMLLTGQPLHAFDYQKVLQVCGSKQPKINVRTAKAGESITLLDSKTIELQPFDILITANDTPIALAGAMGGASTAVDQDTKTIILESATFSLYNLRKTQMAHGIFSEAITRFTKGQPAAQTLAVAKYFSDLVSSSMTPLRLVDCYPQPQNPPRITIDVSDLNQLLGTNYQRSDIIRCLSNVNFSFDEECSCSRKTKSKTESPSGNSCPSCGKDKSSTCTQATSLQVIVPNWRTDIHIPEDIIEEVGRLNGYDNILPILPLHATANPNLMHRFKAQIRRTLSSFGANELLTYSFVSRQLLEKAQQDVSNSYRITNSISPELQYIRQSLVPSLLEKTYLNLKVPYDHFAIFELNQVTQKAFGLDADSVPCEFNHLGFVVADRKLQDGAYYEAQTFLHNLLQHFGITSYRFVLLADSQAHADSAAFEPYRSAQILSETNEIIGVIGELKNSVRANFKLPPYLAAFELNLDSLLPLVKTVKPSPLAFTPQLISEDLTLTVPVEANYTEVYNAIAQLLSAQQFIFELTPISIYQEKSSLNKNLTFHLKFAHPQKTLTNEQIQSIMKKLLEIKISVG